MKTKRTNEIIRIERLRRRWSQEELGAFVGLTTRQITNIECGRRSVIADEIPLFCDAFGISPGELIAAVQREDREHSNTV